MPKFVAAALALALGARAEEPPKDAPEPPVEAAAPSEPAILWRSTDPASGYPAQAWDWLERNYPKKADIWALLSEARKKELLSLALDALMKRAQEERAKAQQSGGDGKAEETVEGARARFGGDAGSAGAELDGASPVGKSPLAGDGADLGLDEPSDAPSDGASPAAVPQRELDDKAPPDVTRKTKDGPDDVPQEDLNLFALDLAFRRVRTPVPPGLPVDPRLISSAAERIVDGMEEPFAVKAEDGRVDLGLAKVAVTDAKDDKMAFKVDFPRFIPFELAGDVAFSRDGTPDVSTKGKMVQSEADRLESRLKSWVGMKTASPGGSKTVGGSGGGSAGGEPGAGETGAEASPLKLGFSPKVSPSLNPYMGGQLTADTYGGQLFAEGGGRFDLKGGAPSPELKAGVKAGSLRVEARTEGAMALDRATLEGRYGTERTSLTAVYDPKTGRTGGGAQVRFDGGIQLGARLERTQRDTTGMVTLDMTVGAFERVVGNLF